MNINPNISIVYDPEIISKIKEMIKEGFEKLKTFVKTQENEINPNFKLYDELNQKFDEISLKLKELGLYEEYNYFLSISDYIVYIIHQNSIDSTFGHCNFTLELLDFFMELFKTTVNYYNSTLKISDKEFKTIQTDFKERYWEYRSQFYCNIYQSTGNYTDKEMYEIHESLRG